MLTKILHMKRVEMTLCSFTFSGASTMYVTLHSLFYNPHSKHVSVISKRIRKIIEVQKRYKKSWGPSVKYQSASEKAQEHFDIFYKPIYGNLWPSIRISLFTTQKYCALVNNYGDVTGATQRLADLGAADILPDASAALQKYGLENIKQNDNDSEKEMLNYTRDNRVSSARNTDNESTENEDSPESDAEEETLPSFLQYEKNTSLHNYVPTKKVYTQKELNEQEEMEKSTYRPHTVPVNVIHEKPIQIPNELQVYTFEKGNASDFPPPHYNEESILEYFLMDGASILPVLALDLQPSDTVLDLCSAPGGKALTMKQTFLPGTIHCNDISKSRLQRVKRVFYSYIPDKLRNNIRISGKDGRHFKIAEYDKVLVDVPCNTDRHVLLDDKNNLFQSARINERLKLPTIQRDLLVAAIMSCVDGGSVVYSTCTLSPSQNEGVVESALEYIWQETDLNVAVVDLTYMAKAFSKTFRFYKKCRFGHLVLPTLRCNFGPMYFCKLRKLKKKI